MDPQQELRVDRIVARDAVEIQQTDRTARCDVADIQPASGTVVLTGNAVVEDVQGTVSGHRITLNQGQRRAVVEGSGSNDGRARITIPGFDGASF